MTIFLWTFNYESMISWLIWIELPSLFSEMSDITRLLPYSIWVLIELLVSIWFLIGVEVVLRDLEDIDMTLVVFVLCLMIFSSSGVSETSTTLISYYLNFSSLLLIYYS